MPVWILLIWLVVGAVAGHVMRKRMRQASPFGKGTWGDMILGGAAGIIGGYLFAALFSTGSTIGGLLGSSLLALVLAAAMVWSTSLMKQQRG